MQAAGNKEAVMGRTEATCFKCRNTVVLAMTDRGAILPLNPGPSEAGALAVSVPGPGKAPRVRYLRGDNTQLRPGEERMRAHWDTHPGCRRRKHATARAARKPRPAVPSPVASRQDLTLDQLATSDLTGLLARTGVNVPARPARGFSSSI